MCGIIGYLGAQPMAALGLQPGHPMDALGTPKEKTMFTTLYDGLQMIQNRGYDSAGIASICNDKFIVHKLASKHNFNALEGLKAYQRDFDYCTIGIAHERWATHGARTDQNAHPHIDCHNRVAIVHNGIIENYLTLKNMLLEHSYKFSSETDSEVIANLISYFYEETGKLEEAINQAINRLEGTWALVIISVLTPNTIYACKNGSPLLVGFNEKEILIASEIAAFCNSVKQYIVLDNNDIVSINRDDLSKLIFNKYKIHPVNQTDIQITPHPYPHWMIKEIEEQPESIFRAMNNGGRIESEHTVKLGGLEKISEKLIKIDNLLILACGTSLYAGMVGLQWFRKFKCFNTVSIMDASEFTIADLPHTQAGVIVISQSGETKDVHRAMELIRQTEVPIISVVNVVDSLIARDADCGCYINCGKEFSVASTKSFTSQCVVLILIAIWFSQKKNTMSRIISNIIQSLGSMPFYARNIINDQRDNAKKLADLLIDKSSCFILGRDSLFPIALESALKLKEIGQIHAEGCAGGSLKHGPFALIDNNMPVIILSNRETEKAMSSTIEEIKSRDGLVIVISNHDVNLKLVDFHIKIDYASDLVNILYIIVIQLTAYHMALNKGHNPDYPRNLAKVVTVDG